MFPVASLTPKSVVEVASKPLDVARGLAFLCSEESGVMTGSIVDFDQTIPGWHSYSVYDSKKMDDSILGE